MTTIYLFVNNTFSFGILFDDDCSDQHKHLKDTEGMPYDQFAEDHRYKCDNKAVHNQASHGVEHDCLCGTLGGIEVR